MSHVHQFIQTTAELQNLAARLAGEPCVALDTEFVWERTFYPILGLVQVALKDGTCFLLDTVAAPDLSPLAGVLSDTGIEKIVHDAPQDLTILNRAAGVPARRVFDTRMAAGFAGMDSQTSLQNLLADLVGVQLPKGHTRTDWTARPLSRDQLEYAVDDVLHMPRVAALLREKARESGVEAWLDEEMGVLFDTATYAERAPEESYLRIKASSYLPPRNLAALKELAAWRERTARQADLPRGFVVTDPELVGVAQVLPETEADFSKCRQLDPRIARRHGAHMLAAVRRGLDMPESQWPKPVAQPDERQVGKERVQALLQAIRLKAEERHIDPRLVASKGDLLQLLSDGAAAKPENHRLLRGWRAELLGNTVAGFLL